LRKKLKKSSLLYFECVQKKIENLYFQSNHFTQTTQTTQQANNKVKMSSISKIVNILSAKYGFDIKEATEHVKAELQAIKNMTKEERTPSRPPKRKLRKTSRPPRSKPRKKPKPPLS